MPCQSDYPYFHTSGRIICIPEATDDDVAELLRLARHVAQASGAGRRTGVLRDLANAFYESAASDALCRASVLGRLRGVMDEAEACWVDTVWDEKFCGPGVVRPVGP
jgi:hypothetical protein